MDPSAITSAALDPAEIVGALTSLARAVGAPVAVVGGLLLLSLMIWAAQHGKAAKAPAPISDGGTEADRENPPARDGGGPAGGGPTGGMG